MPILDIIVAFKKKLTKKTCSNCLHCSDTYVNEYSQCKANPFPIKLDPDSGKDGRYRPFSVAGGWQNRYYMLCSEVYNCSDFEAKTVVTSSSAG